MTSTPNNEEDFRILSFTPPTTMGDVTNTNEHGEEAQTPNPTPQEEAVPLLMNTNSGQNLLRSILIAEHERLHATPPTSPTTTEQGRQTPLIRTNETGEKTTKRTSTRATMNDSTLGPK